MSAITYTVIVFISCVGHRFVFGVAAASRNTRFQAAPYDLTWVGLAPADRASSAWRLHSFDHFVGASEQGMRRPTYDVCDADGSSSSRVFASAKSAAPHPASKNR